MRTLKPNNVDDKVAAVFNTKVKNII
jgi:hypothetical protein